MKLFKKLIRSLYKRLWKDEWTNFNKINDFIKVSSFSPYIKQWHEYTKNETEKKKYNALIKDLSQKDIDVVNLFFDRIKIFTDLPDKNNLYYINPEELYTEEEKQEKVKALSCIPVYKNVFLLIFMRQMFYMLTAD